MVAISSGTMSLARQTLYKSERLRVSHLIERPTSTRCGPIEHCNVDALVLPLSGVFAMHDGSNVAA